MSGWWIASIEHWLAIAAIEGITPPPTDLIARATAVTQMLTPAMCIPLSGLCVLVDQRTALHRDNQGRLHCETGPAWAWGDGTEIWALQGIRVPSWVITDPDPARMLGADLPNTEQRRVALAAYGWDRAAADLDMSVIDEHDDRRMGTLYHLPDTVLDEPGQATLLVVDNASPDRDGTVRRYGLLARGDCRTVIEAQASLAQLTVPEFLALDGAS